jgi:F420-0:gamma-glutamyl ligase-like protein
MKMEAHCYYASCCVFCKVEDLCNWIHVVIFDTIAMITIFYTVVLSVIQGVALNTGVLPFLKGRALQVITTY